MLANHGGIDIRLGLVLLWATPGGGHTVRRDSTGQMQEIEGDALLRGQGDQHAWVIAGDLDGQVVGGHIEFSSDGFS